MISDLRHPSALPDKTDKVSLVQTHISLVFVADAFVYKIKKPVDFGFLDFSSLEKRGLYCRKEMELNRRLSQGIYLDVLPVTFDGERHSLRGDKGEVVDYALKMKRIPPESLMRSIFDRGELSEGHLKQVAEVLARFHIHAQRSPEIDTFGEMERFKINTDENFEQVEKYIGASVQENVFHALKNWTDQFYKNQGILFSERIQAGAVRDCHGDLHMEHVCFIDPLAIIDCIEFNDRFRYSDRIADIAFLLMDLEFHGGEEYSRLLWREYKERVGEGDVETLLNFYKVYRAFVRGKVISFQIDDPGISQEDKQEALEKAGRYFGLAYDYIR